MSGPWHDARLRPVADFEPADGVGQLGDEGVVNPVLRIDAVGADAGLAHVAEFRGDRAVDRGVDIGVVEHDERRVAAELEPDLLHRPRRLAHEELADLGRAGEADEAHRRMLAHRLADGGRIAGQHVEDARRKAGADGELGQRQRRQRRLRRRLDHRRAADRQGGGDLAGDHRGREIPRRDRGDDPDRLLEDEDARIGAEGRVDLAINPLGLLAEELDKARGVVDFAARLGEGLSLLARHDQREIVAVGDDEVEPAPQNVGALLRQLLRPGPEGFARRLDRPNGLGVAKARNPRDQRAGRRIADRIEALADPCPSTRHWFLRREGSASFMGSLRVRR